MTFPFGERLSLMRKKKKFSQEELAKAIGAHAPVIGRYERSEVKPSFEVAAKLAQKLGTSLDYLAGLTDQELENDLMQKMNAIQALSDEDREHILRTLEALIRDAKARKAYSDK